MLRGIWRLSGLASSPTSPAPADSEENIVNTRPRNGEHRDQMEGLEFGNSLLATEEVVRVGGKKAKSKDRAKKSKKSRKSSIRDIEETQSQELPEMDSMENGSARDDGVEVANIDLPSSAKKAKKKKSRRTKSAKQDEVVDHARSREDDDAELKSQRVAQSDATREDNLAELPWKMKKTKRAKSRKSAESLHVASQDSGDVLDKALYQPLTPAHQSHLPLSIHHEDSSIGTSEVDNELLPRRIATSEDILKDAQSHLSENTLGKRKAIDEPVKQGRKKKARKSSFKETQEQDLREPSSDELQREQIIINNANNTSSSKRGSKTPSKSTVNGLAETQAQDNNDDDQSGQDKPEVLPEPSFEAAISTSSESRKRRKRRLPVHDDNDPSGQPENTSLLKSETPKAKTPRTPKSAAKASGSQAASATKNSLTFEDTTTISEAIETYRQFNDLSQYQVNHLIQQPTKIGHALWTSLYEDLPTIPRRNIHAYTRRNFHNFEGRGVWTEEQDEELREAYQRNPNKWKTIGQELNRFGEDARDRWRNYLVCAGNMKKDVWDKAEETQLLAIVNDFINAIREERRRTKAEPASLDDEEKLVDWQKVSEKMNHTRSRLQCSYKWRRIKALSQSDDENERPDSPIGQSWRLRDAKVEARVATATEKLRLLRAIRDSGAGNEGKIPWVKISLELNEMGKRMVWRLIIRKLKKRLPGNKEMKFRDIIKRLVEIFEESSPNEPAGFDIIPTASAKDDNDSDRMSTDNDELDKGTAEAYSPGGTKKSKAKSKARKRKAKKADADNGEGPSTPTKKKRKVRDRMRRQDEPEEPAGTTGSGDEVVVDGVGEDLVASLEVLRSGKGSKRKSKSQKFLSEEKIVEDPSDDDDAVSNDQMNEDQVEEDPVDEDQIDEDQVDEYQNDKDQVYEDQIDAESSVDIAVKVETIDGQAHETESIDLDDTDPNLNGFYNHNPSDLDEDQTINANGLEDDVELDTNDSDRDESVSQGTSREEDRMIYHRLADKNVETYFKNSTSDDDSVSSIPARIVRNGSIEL